MSDKINVCLMNDSFAPIIDGVANVVMNYANIISTDNLGKATVVTPNFPGAEDNYPFDVVRYRSMNITKKICGYRAGYPFSSSKLDALAGQDFNVIHSHCPFASTLMARVLREKCNVPIILTYHTKFDIDIRRSLPTKLMAEQAIKFVVSNISACDEVWTVSRGAGENLRSLGYKGDFVVMENGVDFPRGRADENAAAELRKKYGISPDEFLFMFVGRLLWYKGLKIILDAVKILAAKNLRFRMMIVGDGIERDEIEAYAKEIGVYDKCIFTGAVTDREELRVYYTAGELFVFPSEYDTNGIVVREAAACGMASILIEGSCAAEGITDGRTGVLSAPDAACVADKMEFAVLNREKMRVFGDNAMREVYISWEDAVKNAVKRYPEVVERCVKGQTQRREGVVTEEFFVMMDNVTKSIQKIRSIPTGIKKKSTQTKEKIKSKTSKKSSSFRKKKAVSPIPDGFSAKDIRIEQSVCTGERTIGFFSREQNKLMFSELVRDDEDIKAFYHRYGIMSDLDEDDDDILP